MQAIYIVFIVIILLFTLAAFFLYRQLRITQNELSETSNNYETRIRDMMLKHQQDIDKARHQSVEQSRHTIKGQIAEQLAPLLPGFPYHPSDCRFIGDPVDYVIFKGYSEHKEYQASEVTEPLEIVVIDIKHNRASLSEGQKRIAKTIESRRVRFETIRISDDGKITVHPWISANNNQWVSTTAIPDSETKLGTDDGNCKSDNQRTRMLKILEKYPNAYKPWDLTDDNLLREKFLTGMKAKSLSELFQRRPSAIKARLKKIGFKP
jgi:predicted Holliday junction resolvase-like endonuclease